MKPGMSFVGVVVTALVAVLASGSGAATASGGLSVSSTIAGADLSKGPALSGKVHWIASPKGAEISKVVFTIDGTPRWTENWSPYEFNGDDNVLDTTTLSNGTHSFAAVAYAGDSQTAVAQGSATVSNGQSFTVASSVANGSTLSGSLIWAAIPKGPSVSKVEFLIDGTLRWTENWGPYQFNGDDGALDTTKLSNGAHTLAVVAYASRGATATAQSSVTVSNQSAGGGQQSYPNPPTDLTVTDASQQTTLTATWTGVIGASGYRVGRNSVALADTSRTTYTWTSLACATKYTLSVQPERSPKDNGGRVATVSATTAACASSGGGGGSDTPAFNGDFETGNISQWASTPLGGAQCFNYGVTSEDGFLYVVRDVVAKGSYSGRFDLPAANVANSCELLRGRTIALDDEWYSMEVRFPNDWREPSPAGWGMSLAQFNFQNIWGSPVSLNAHSDYVDLTLNAGLCTTYTTSNPSCQYSSGIQGNVPSQHIIPTSAFSTGTWHQLLIHIKWTNGNDGILEGFHRLRGETTWTKTAELTGYPTVQRTASYTWVASDRTVDKIGAYRGAASFPLSLWQDNFCEATTRAAAEACF